MPPKRHEEIIKKMKEHLAGFNVEAVKNDISEALQMKMSTQKLIEIMSKEMEIVGKKYEDGECFVPELIMAGETVKEAMQALKPHMKKKSGSRMGTVVVATVAGDIHDIGKDIFIRLMIAAGFEVIDLGVDVPPEKIVEAVRHSDASIVGLSALLTTNLEQIPIVVDAFEKQGLKSKVKIIVGGATVTEEYAKLTGTDAYAKTASAGVNICTRWRKKGKRETIGDD
jgi:methylmalonyl-CoA mutase cobalamin-binding domain/chain